MKYRLTQASNYCSYLSVSKFNEILSARFNVSRILKPGEFTDSEYYEDVFISLNSLSELCRFMDVVGSIVIYHGDDENDTDEICIYDDYIE